MALLPRGRARFPQDGNCCPNDDKVSLGCCNGFPKVVEEVQIASCCVFAHHLAQGLQNTKTVASLLGPYDKAS